LFNFEDITLEDYKPGDIICYIDELNRKGYYLCLFLTEDWTWAEFLDIKNNKKFGCLKTAHRIEQEFWYRLD